MAAWPRHPPPRVRSPPLRIVLRDALSTRHLTAPLRGPGRPRVRRPPQSWWDRRPPSDPLTCFRVTAIWSFSCRGALDANDSDHQCRALRACMAGSTSPAGRTSERSRRRPVRACVRRSPLARSRATATVHWYAAPPAGARDTCGRNERARERDAHSNSAARDEPVVDLEARAQEPLLRKGVGLAQGQAQ